MNVSDIHFSPALMYLLSLLRAAIGTGETLPKPEREVDWDEFLRLVERHRTAGLLHRRARPAITAHCPPAIASRIAALSQATAQRSLQLAAEHVRLVRVLEREGIASIGVKGIPLAQRLYGEQGIRHVGDIDLFIRQRDVLRADEILRGDGLKRTNPDFALTPRQHRCFVASKPEFEYVRKSTAIRIELLWRLEGLPTEDRLWALSASDGGSNVLARTLPAELDALYVLHHGARHGWFRLFWLVDAALLFRSAALDWHVLIAEARKLDLALPVLQAAELARDLLHAPIPTALAASRAERSEVDAVVLEAKRQIAREALAHEGVGEWARQLRYRLKLQQTMRRRWAVLAPHIHSPESWRAMPLPDRWFFLYPLLTPWLWLKRRAPNAGTHPPTPS